MLPTAGQKAKMLYEMPGGIFRKRDVVITAEGLIQPKMRWFHDNHESCVFPIEQPIRLDTYEQLIDAPDAPHPEMPEGWMVIGEENGFFPYSTKVILDWQDVENRQNYRLEYQDVGRQNAELKNIRYALGNPLLTTFAMMAAGVIALMVVIAATALILTVVNDNTGGPEPAAMLGILGAVAALPRLRMPRLRGRVRKEKVARQPVDPRWTVYLYCTVTGKKKRYSLPFSEIYAHIPSDAWRYPVRTFWRRGGALAAGGLVLFWHILIGAAAPEYTLLVVPSAVILTPLAAILGFFMARRVMARISWFNKPYAKVYRHRDEDGNYFLSPIRYTGLTGVDPMVWESLIFHNLEMVQELAAREKLDQMPQFDPIVNRADDVYEDITGKLEAEDTRIPMSTAQKIQLTSVVVMACGSVATAFFIVMATLG